VRHHAEQLPPSARERAVRGGGGGGVVGGGGRLDQLPAAPRLAALGRLGGVGRGEAREELLRVRVRVRVRLTLTLTLGLVLG